MPSYSPVFSQGFIYYTQSTPNTEFAVPAGFTAVVREFDVWEEAGEAVAWMGVQLSGEAPFVNVASLEPAGVNSSAQWTGRVVVPAGGNIGIAIGELGASDTAYVGGYLLRNVAA